MKGSPGGNTDGDFDGKQPSPEYGIDRKHIVDLAELAEGKILHITPFDVSPVPLAGQRPSCACIMAIASLSIVATNKKARRAAGFALISWAR
ncbi:MAG: hypothetical protein QM744_16270 [Mesorhizobium sp.]